MFSKLKSAFMPSHEEMVRSAAKIKRAESAKSGRHLALTDVMLPDSIPLMRWAEAYYPDVIKTRREIGYFEARMRKHSVKNADGSSYKMTEDNCWAYRCDNGETVYMPHWKGANMYRLVDLARYGSHEVHLAKAKAQDRQAKIERLKQRKLKRSRDIAARRASMKDADAAD